MGMDIDFWAFIYDLCHSCHVEYTYILKIKFKSRRPIFFQILIMQNSEENDKFITGLK